MKVFDCTSLLAVFIISVAITTKGCTDEDFCDGLEQYCSSEGVKGWCPKLCNVCPQVDQVDEDCVDDNVGCPGWKSFCQYSTWTQDNCKKTCDLCGSKAWSKCTRSCGGGTRHREECQNGQCKFIFEMCSTSECGPEAVCDPRNSEPRYGLSHACCSKERSQCGIPKQIVQRVTGGVNAKRRQWPWMAAVAGKDDLCGGTIISTSYLLTAAHCLVDRNGVLDNLKDVIIHVDILRMNEANPGNRVHLKKIVVHPKYSFPFNDIAIVELKSPLQFSATVIPVCLPGGEKTPIDSTCFITGWGQSQHSYSSTNHLQEAAVKNFDRRACHTAYENETDILPFVTQSKGYLCAGSLDGSVDTCMGDSGGPLVCQRCSSCTWYLAGITSAGPVRCATKGVPGIYTEVLEYEDWISKVTGQRHTPKSCPGGTGP